MFKKILNINEYAKINTSGSTPVDRRGNPAKPLTFCQQLLIFVGTLIGVILKPAVDTLKAGNTPDLKVAIPTIIVSIVISLIVIALTYRKEGLHTDAPLIVQIGYALQSGLLWQTLISIPQ